MVLVDRKIRYLVDSENLIINYNEDRLNSISYDVVIDKFILDNNEIDMEEYILSRNSFVFVKTLESLNMMSDLCCMVIEKNSLMRNGLKVDGPLYQPGHKTNIFLRVLNISNSDIILKKDMEIAQLIFMKLSDVPDNTYDMQNDARYNNEDVFRG